MTKWNDLKHKSTPEVRARLEKEAHAELERADALRGRLEQEAARRLAAMGGSDPTAEAAPRRRGKQ
jgi:hypothetical protein